MSIGWNNLRVYLVRDEIPDPSGFCSSSNKDEDKAQSIEPCKLKCFRIKAA